MDAKDLMIGDWVLAERSEGIYGGPVWNQTGRIIEIMEDEVEVLFPDEYGNEDYDEKIYFDVLKEINGIPLTPEILEKNGFIRKHPESEKRAYWILRVAGGNVKVKRNWGYFYFEVTGTPLEMGMFLPHFEGHLAFVHELQHALRLCGIKKEIEL